MARPSLDLDVDSPEKVVTVLWNAIDAYEESAGELASAWQDPRAGKAWSGIAKILEEAARKIEKLKV